MIRFALYIHNHQPTGNFEQVFEYAYTHSYLPLLEVLMKHSGIKFGIHNSGILMEWMVQHHPEYIEMLKHAVDQGQAEILTSAYAEPILSFIPKKDAVEQIRYYSDFIYKYLQVRPKGLWLTERIWEPHLIHTILDAGLEYTLLDDTHFLYAGLENNDLFSYYITEDEGRKLKVFPISMKLRYLIPFHQIEETIDFLRNEEQQQPGILRTLGDDGEKFGVWPGTHDWVFNKGWLNNFLARLAQEKWIKTVFLKDISAEPPAGNIYLPTSSYEEMGEWVLPPARGTMYEELKKTIDSKYFYLIHGGYFRNFLRRYPEANHMQKRMLYVSKNIADNQDAKMALWRGQCSCAFWHGIFGGLYLPHLREAIYKNLIDAENYNIPRVCESDDFDADGQEEIIVSNDRVFAILKPKSASFVEIDDRLKKLNLLNFIGRRKEKYHQRIPQHTLDQDVKSIHEIFQSKEADLVKYLIYDSYERGFGLDRRLDTVPNVDSFMYGEDIGAILSYDNYEISNTHPCVIKFSGDIKKMITIDTAPAPTITIAYQGDVAIFGIEFSFGVFDSTLTINKGLSVKATITEKNITHYTIQGALFKSVTTTADLPFDLLSYPIETISSSESGFERNFQGFCVLLIFKGMPKVTIAL